MIPAKAIQFVPGALPNDGVTLFFSMDREAVAALCMFDSGALGLVWLSGPEAGQTANLDGQGFFLPNCEIEVDGDSLILLEEPVPMLSLLKAGNSTAIRSQTTNGATRIYTIAGSPFGDPSNFATFSLWRAISVDGTHRHVVQVVGQPLVS